MSSPTSRSLEKLRADGWTCQKVEYFDYYAKRRKDLWGADIIAFRGPYIFLIQTTDSTSHAKRRAKVLALPEAAKWVADHFRGFVIHSWGLKGKRGERKTYQCRDEVLTTEMFKDAMNELEKV